MDSYTQALEDAISVNHKEAITEDGRHIYYATHAHGSYASVELKGIEDRQSYAEELQNLLSQLGYNTFNDVATSHTKYLKAGRMRQHDTLEQVIEMFNVWCAVFADTPYNVTDSATNSLTLPQTNVTMRFVPNGVLIEAQDMSVRLELRWAAQERRMGIVEGEHYDSLRIA